MSQVSSAADLTASVRRTKGDRPPPLVGCSVTRVGDSIYVFGGRLVPTRTMVSTLYSLDLRTLEWVRLWPRPAPTGASKREGDDPEASATTDGSSEPAGPQARYFHSACAWNDKLVIFGGEGYHVAVPPSPSPSTASSSIALESSGASTRTDSSTQPALETLDDLQMWDTVKREWVEIDQDKIACKDGVERPKARYAHLGVVCTGVVDDDDDNDDTEAAKEEKTAGDEQAQVEVGETQGEKRRNKEKSCLLIMGGQDIRNTYLHSTDVLDLDTLTWISTGKWDRHIGTYRAVATTSPLTVHPTTGLARSAAGDSRRGSTARGIDRDKAATDEDDLVELSWSEPTRKDDPEPLLLFSNFNFTQVRRDLDLLSSPLSPTSPLAPTPLSSHMTGTPSLPPGLRFPSGFQVGRHLVIFGTFLSQHFNHFSIWALDLGVPPPRAPRPAATATGTSTLSNGERNTTESSPGEGSIGRSVSRALEAGKGLEWMRIDPGNVLQRGSWNRAVGWGNNVVVLGDRERDIAADYDHRQTNFTHVAFVDLEAHGVYQPPPRALPPVAQRLGLATLRSPLLSDFEVVCSDGRRVACSRKVLEERWSWFRVKMDEFRVRASGVVFAQQKRNASSATESSEAGSLAGEAGAGGGAGSSKNSPAIDGTTTAGGGAGGSSSSGGGGGVETKSTATIGTDEARLTPRTLHLPEPSPVVVAFVEYLYSQSLCTPLQTSLPILSALLVLSRTYSDESLRALVVHALHERLSASQDPTQSDDEDRSVAPAVYEAATLGGCTALQIRSLKALMASPRSVAASRTGSAGGRAGAGGGGGGGGEFETATNQGAAGQSARPFGSTSSVGSGGLGASGQSSSSNAIERSTRQIGFTATKSVEPDPSSTPATGEVDPASPPLDRSALRASIPVPLWSTFSSPTSPAAGALPTSPVSTISFQLSTSNVASPGSTASDARSPALAPTSYERSRAGSVGSSRSTGSSAGKRSMISTRGQEHRLETQLEEASDQDDFPSEAERDAQDRPEAPVATVGVRAQARRSDETGRSGASSGHKRFSLGSIVRPPSGDHKGKSGAETGEADGAGSSEGVWQPMFLDSVRTRQGERSASNPLSTRKATPITLEHLALLDASFEPSLPIVEPESGSLEEPARFVEPRPAPAPTVSTRVAQFEAHLTPPLQSSRTTSSFDFVRRRGSSSSAGRPRASTSGSIAPSIGMTTSAGSTPGSAAMDRLPSSSSGHSISSQEGSELATPPMPSRRQFEPTIVEHGYPSPPSAHPGFTSSSLGLFKRRPSAAPLGSEQRRDVDPRTASTALLQSTEPSSPSPPPRRTSLLPGLSRGSAPSTSSMSKKRRNELEVEVGTRLLRAAGATDKEVQLRAKSVGWQVLKARETGDYSKLPKGMFEQGGVGLEAARTGDVAGAIERFVGGDALASKFSLD
ncbi:hypothetical protein JCM10212_005280 [Sporobolomyces blumeae]